MFKLDLQKCGEPEIQLPTSTGPQKKQKNSRITSTSPSLTMLKPLTVWITTNSKILKEMGIPDHLTCLLKILYVGELDMGQYTGPKLRKEYVKAIYYHLSYLTCIWNTSCEMPGWMNHKLESRLLGDISITSDMQHTTLVIESKEELKSLLMYMKEESEKVG